MYAVIINFFEIMSIDDEAPRAGGTSSKNFFVGPARGGAIS